MSNTITWSQIESECGDYRAGFVATFRKYEGQDTDEKDGQGRTVKVTMSSFARHAGIADKTFQRWAGAAAAADPPRDRTREGVDRMPAEDKAKLAAELLADEDVAEQVVADKQARHNVTRAANEHYQRQATERTERTERKAAADPTDRSVDALLWVNRLGEAAERWARDGSEALRQVGPLPDSERYWLTGAVDRAEGTVRAARRYLELGNSEINTELEALLENGG
jgi:hypothetical protein